MSGQLVSLTAKSYGPVTVITPQGVTGPAGITISGGTLAVIQGPDGVTLITSGITITGLTGGTISTQLLSNTTLPYDFSQTLNGYYLPIPGVTGVTGAVGAVSIAGGRIIIDPLILSDPVIQIQYPAVIFIGADYSVTTFVFPQVIIPILKEVAGVPLHQFGTSVYGTITSVKPTKPKKSHRKHEDHSGWFVVTDGTTGEAIEYTAYYNGSRASPNAVSVLGMITDVSSGQMGLFSKHCITVTTSAQPKIVRPNYNKHNLGYYIGVGPVPIADGTFTVPLAAIQPAGPINVPTYNGLEVIFAGTPLYTPPLGPLIPGPYQLFYATLAISGPGVFTGTIVNPPSGLTAIAVDSAMPIESVYFNTF